MTQVDSMRLVDSMRKLNHTLVAVVHVISEPGDGTRYEYIVHRVLDDFHFISLNNFRYPNKINKYDALDRDIIKVAESGEVIPNTSLITELANSQFCNFYTMLECINYVLETVGEPTIPLGR